MGTQSDTQIFEAIVEHIPLMIFVKDAKHLRFVLFNRAGEELLGLTRAELYGKCDYDFFPREQAEFFIARDREVLEGKLPVSIEEPIETKSGPRFLLTKKVPILDAQGEPLYLLGLSLDITERKLAERARDEKDAALSTALRHSVALQPKLRIAQRAHEIGAQIEKLLDTSLTGESVGQLRTLAKRLSER
jgi:PAS domain S-box-containing protein